MAEKWLKDYYGKDFNSLSPLLVMDGNVVAVVKLTRKASRGFNRVGYVLIKKNGRHNASDHIVLHEGVASKEDLETMKRVLVSKDS